MSKIEAQAAASGPCNARTAAAIVVAAFLMTFTAEAQRVADIGFESVGRGAPLAVAIPVESFTNMADTEAYPPAEIES